GVAGRQKPALQPGVVEPLLVGKGGQGEPAGGVEGAEVVLGHALVADLLVIRPPSQQDLLVRLQKPRPAEPAGVPHQHDGPVGPRCPCRSPRPLRSTGASAPPHTAGGRGRPAGRSAGSGRNSPPGRRTAVSSPSCILCRDNRLPPRPAGGFNRRPRSPILPGQ